MYTSKLPFISRRLLKTKQYMDTEFKKYIKTGKANFRELVTFIYNLEFVQEGHGIIMKTYLKTLQNGCQILWSKQYQITNPTGLICTHFHTKLFELRIFEQTALV